MSNDTNEQRLQARIEVLSAHLDVADRDIERAHAQGEAMLLRLFGLLDRGDLRSALQLIDNELGPRGHA